MRIQTRVCTGFTKTKVLLTATILCHIPVSGARQHIGVGCTKRITHGVFISQTKTNVLTGHTTADISATTSSEVLSVRVAVATAWPLINTRVTVRKISLHQV